ncbi:uncharacterized protein LOC124159867 [Ischnura elegans]|uniref:uncharacterized protein LOC124159867 n=1 Tax=Ischnura elegans TaxID=197161 RepID=UPI001ED876C5|nr:uncharacterized protein LOC124159867 [Ischnura elegans]
MTKFSRLIKFPILMEFPKLCLLFNPNVIATQSLRNILSSIKAQAVDRADIIHRQHLSLQPSQLHNICTRPSPTATPTAMNCRVIFYFAVTLVALAMLSTSVGASSYRKAPMNGSIFGKRNGITSAATEAEYYRNGAFSALCEAAMEFCSSWAAAPQDAM